MTLEALRASTRKTLAVMARRHGVDGWHSMTKAQLIEALAAIPRLKRRTAALQTETSGEFGGFGQGNGPPPETARQCVCDSQRARSGSAGQAPQKFGG